MGKIPNQLMNLTNLEWLNICNNHLYTNDPDLVDFLNSKGGDWESCQTSPFFKAMRNILQRPAPPSSNPVLDIG